MGNCSRSSCFMYTPSAPGLARPMTIEHQGNVIIPLARTTRKRKRVAHECFGREWSLNLRTACVFNRYIMIIHNRLTLTLHGTSMECMRQGDHPVTHLPTRCPAAANTWPRPGFWQVGVVTSTKLGTALAATATVTGSRLRNPIG